MKVEIISVGTELLLGNIVNTNAAFLAKQCAALGLFCYYQTTVGDNRERLLDAIQTAFSRSDIILMTGGLGPTKDDLTKETVAAFLGRSMYKDEASACWIKDYFAKKGKEIAENNWKQAMMPEGAIVIRNENGTAPGVIVEEGEKCIILLPGPPIELEPMFMDSIYSYLQNKSECVLVSQTVKICGIGESTVESMITDLIDAQENPTIAPYAKTGEVHLRVTASAEDERHAQKLLKPVVKQLKERFKEHIYTTDENVSLEQSVVDLLVANSLTISTVESCTGGLLAGRLINVAGVSEVFKKGLITYSNKAKRKMIGVKKSLLEKYGAVSEQVAIDMAKGAAVVTKADVTVSVTGIAGPDGGSEEKPVGTVFIACSVKGDVTVRKYHFTGSREKIRRESVSAAIVLLRECVLHYISAVTFGKRVDK